MAQVKIYGRADQLRPRRAAWSDLVHRCLVDALGVPPEKRFQRFFPLPPEDFVYPADRSERYTILEIGLFTGRSVDAKKTLFRLLYERAREELGLDPVDLEITLIESPRHDWGIRGRPGDELDLPYRVDV